MRFGKHGSMCCACGMMPRSGWVDAVSSCGASRRKGYAFGAECVEIDELESSSAMAVAVIEGTGDGKRGQVKGWQGGQG